ncbi:TIGR02391 family protein [Blastococcus sp. TML/C7B]|nr:TIGR02391 family protein [Blastococcus sp. TML/C7B]
MLPRTEWAVSEADALDLFSMLSYLHRRLDRVTVDRRI